MSAPRQIHGWDPSQRDGEHITIVGFEDCDGLVPSFGERVLLVESESGVVADGTVIDVNEQRRLVYLHFRNVRTL